MNANYSCTGAKSILVLHKMNEEKAFHHTPKNDEYEIWLAGVFPLEHGWKISKLISFSQIRIRISTGIIFSNFRTIRLRS